MTNPGPKAIVLLSGGIDSTTTLALAQRQGFEVYALTFRYGQRHQLEVEAARRIAGALRAARHEIIDLDLRRFGGSALTDDIAVPKDRTRDEIAGAIPVTYVPARNTIFLAFALAWAEVLGAADIFVGVNALAADDQDEKKAPAQAEGKSAIDLEALFKKLDKDGDGSVSLDEMSSALKGGGGKGHHHHMASSSGDSTGADGSSSDPLLQALQGASSTSTTNSDGSTTTSLTYADGSKVTMTSAASASSSATSSYNFIEQLIQRQSQAISAQASSSLSVSA